MFHLCHTCVRCTVATDESQIFTSELFQLSHLKSYLTVLLSAQFNRLAQGQSKVE